MFSTMKHLTWIVFLGIIFASCGSPNVNDANKEAKTGSNEDSIPEAKSKKEWEKEIKIGQQVWTTENLNVDKFRNGDIIPEAKSEEEWIKAAENKQAAWCYYDKDPKNGTKYGKLYNWYAVNDPRGLAPLGWHIPSDKDWDVLTDYLGGAEKAGAKMKSKKGWIENGNGNNSSGFNGLPGGSRYDVGSFNIIHYFGFWWSSSEYNKSLAWVRDLYFRIDDLSRDSLGKDRGFSVRCLKDSR